MSPKRTRLALVIALLAGVPAPAATAQTPVPRPPEPPLVEIVPSRVEDRRFAVSTGDDVVRVGQDYALGAGEVVDEVVVIMGNARLEGRALRDVTVILGDVDLGPGAVVRSLSVVGGRTTIQPGARIERDVFTFGGTFETPPGFSAGGEQIIIGSALFDEQIQALTPWITRGLLWGRPIVPGLPWIWPIVGLFFLLYLVVNALFERPARLVATTVVERPLTTFVAGIVAMILAGPLVLLLAITVVGLLIVPIVFCALFAALVLGKVGVMRAIGMSIIPEHDSGPLPAGRSYVLGFAALVVAYMVPVIGFATMGLLAVVGLGGSAIAFVSAYRRENPAPPRVAPTPPQPPPPPSPPPSFQHPVPAGGSMSMASDVPPLSDPVSSAHVVPNAGGTAALAGLAVFPHAMFLDRLAAFVLDVFLVLISWQILWPFRRAFGGDGLFLALFAYHVGFWTWKGTTVGGIICQLRVVRLNGGPLQFVDAFVRGLAAIFSLAALGLGGLWILKDPERQAWHDRIAGTYVVKVPRNHPI